MIGRVNVGGSGSSLIAIISVTNATANATVTATNGEDVFTATATSSGTAVISIKKVGYYVVSCNEKYSPSSISILESGSYSARMLDVPTTYQAVEFLQSSGSQWIDSSVLADTNIKISCDYTNTSTASSDQVLFGGRYSTSSAAIYYFIRQAETDISRYYYSNGNIQTIARDTSRHTIQTNGNTITVDGTDYTASGSGTFATHYAIYIFALNGSGDVKFKSSAKIYSFKMYDGSSLIRDFIPCYRKSDSVAGMYDKVNDVFYTNSGSGTFVVGEDVA